jgi:2-polyprenyl-6-methoxyphenol hydroxylase-like FAD-dependent oxidoreductase
MNSLRVLVIGGGIGGLCLAHGLKQAGVNVSVYERQAASASESASESYSIHLNAAGNAALHECLPANVWAALRENASQPVTGFAS